ncbi:hypothetical protein PLICRDRAFT_322094 [Plicaturopsis crispa FD-325 SS-3]|nr:hypothetical protein PLICRDRAFT_322094 [Plicaturopsis crispa FD-325 SS-3]
MAGASPHDVFFHLFIPHHRCPCSPPSVRPQSAEDLFRPSCWAFIFALCCLQVSLMLRTGCYAQSMVHVFLMLGVLQSTSSRYPWASTRTSHHILPSYERHLPTALARPDFPEQVKVGTLAGCALLAFVCFYGDLYGVYTAHCSYRSLQVGDNVRRACTQVLRGFVCVLGRLAILYWSILSVIHSQAWSKPSVCIAITSAG